MIRELFVIPKEQTVLGLVKCNFRAIRAHLDENYYIWDRKRTEKGI